MASRPPTIKQEQEIPYSPLPEPPRGQSTTATMDVIDLISSEDEDDLEVQQTRPDKRSRVSNGENGAQATKRKKPGTASDTLPIGFLEPLPRSSLAALALSALPPPPTEITPNSSIEEIDPNSNAIVPATVPAKGGSKQFWKAGDYEGSPEVGSSRSSVSGLDHVRVHPKFLHSNATSHKWALGALAELLDNSLDEVANGATFVNIDMVQNSKDGSKMLLVEDNGGGMSPDKLRQCMSLGYSAKSKIASTIGQYGNGFKTSTMRLGADVIVFSRSSGKNGARPTQSIGMLSYTFLRSTGKEDIVVPMLDFENENGWKKLKRTNLNDWNTNLEIIVQWSPYSSEADLLGQFSTIKNQGTRIIIYNLWEDDQGDLELDFDSDPHDIQIRGVNRDEKNIEKAKEYPNSKHYLTYRHSLRSYASILYLRLPHVFQMILRGEEIEHHNIVNDMMLKQDVYYRPQLIESAQKDPQMVAAVTIGFVKDAKHHIDVQGFNVYHKNRLIKPFWRVWTAAGSGGRGVIGVLEANFIEPAHDKQDFERTTMLSRLEARLNQMQKNYWSKFSNQIGYGGGSQSRKKDKDTDTFLTDSSPQRTSQPPPPPPPPTAPSSPNQTPKSGKFFRVNHTTAKASTSRLNNSKKRLEEEEFESSDDSDPEYTRATASQSMSQTKSRPNLKPTPSPIQRVFLQKRHCPVVIRSSTPSPVGIGSEERVGVNGGTGVNGSSTKSPSNNDAKGKSKENGSADDSASIIRQLKTENEELQEKITELELKMSRELQMEKDMNKSLTEQLEETQRKLEETSKEQDALIDIFSEERIRRDKDEENLRKKLKDASDTIQGLFEKLGSARK